MAVPVSSRPGTEVLSSQQPEFDGLRLQGWMTDNLSTYLSNPGDTQFGAELYPRQIESLEKLLALMQDRQTAGDATTTGYYDLTTGFGKTWLMRAIAEGVGVGRDAPDGTRVRALQLAPLTTILDDLAEAFDGAPFRDDLTQMSDRAFLLLSPQERAELLNDRPLVLLDESHTKLGPNIRRAVGESRQGRLTLGFSGTVDYHSKKRTTHLLGAEIDRYSTREAIDDGYLRPLQLFAVSTGVRTPSRVQEGDERLSDNEERNRVILDTVQFAVESGRQGLVSCIDGNDCAHADNLAGAAGRLKIFDQAKREYRPVVARAVHGYKKSEDIKEAIAGYRAGRVDVLFHHGMIGMGFHSDRTDFLINGKPYRSPVESAQHLGRVLEPEDEDKNGGGRTYGLVFDLVDEGPDPNRVLAFDLLGEDRIEPGLIIGPKNGKDPRHQTGQATGAGTTRSSTEVPTPATLPPSLAALSEKLRGKIVREIFVESKRDREIVPDGLTPATETALAEIVTDEKWVNRVLDARGIMRRRYNRKWHVADDELATLDTDNLNLPDFLTSPRVTLDDAAKRLGVSKRKLSEYVASQSIITISTGPGQTNIPESELSKIETSSYSAPPFDPQTDFHVEQLRDLHNLNVTRIRRFSTSRTVDNVPQPLALYLRRVDGESVLCVNTLDAQIIDRHFSGRVPESAVRLSDLSVASGGLALGELRRSLQSNGLLRYLETAYSPDINDDLGPPIQYFPRGIGDTALRAMLGARVDPHREAQDDPGATSSQDTSEEQLDLSRPTEEKGDQAEIARQEITPSLSPHASVAPSEIQPAGDPPKVQNTAPPRERLPLARSREPRRHEIPSLGVDTRDPLTVEDIAGVTGRTLNEVKAVVKTLPYSPNVNKQAKRGKGNITRLTTELHGPSLDETLIRLVGLTIEDAVRRLDIPKPHIINAMVSAGTTRDESVSGRRLTLKEWKMLTGRFPLPPPNWRMLQEAAAAGGMKPVNAQHFVRRFGGRIDEFHDSSGRLQPHISKFFYNLLKSQAHIAAYGRPPSYRPHNWLTIRERTGAEPEEFNRWAAQKGPMTVDLSNMHTTYHDGATIVLPHFSEKEVKLFELERLRRKRR